MTDKERLLKAGRIQTITRGRVSRADREWLDANPETDARGEKVKAPTNGVINIPPQVWPNGTKAVAVDGSGVAGPCECCSLCGVSYLWCICHERPGRPRPMILVGANRVECDLVAPD